MKTSSIAAVAVLLTLLVTFASAQNAAPLSVQKLSVVGGQEGVGVEINASGPITTEAQILTGPDRLVIDFPGALPGNELRGLRLNQGDIKAVRAGLFRSNPPVTRVVIDLKAPTAYRLVCEGSDVLVVLGSEPKVESAENAPAVTVERHPTARAIATLAQAPDPPLRVWYAKGILSISANKATLADVLYQVHVKTGAEIPIPSGAEREQVALEAGPGPAREVLATLLNGSGFNYVLQGTQENPQSVTAVLLTPKSNAPESAYTPPPPEPAQAAAPALQPVPSGPPVNTAPPPTDTSAQPDPALPPPQPATSVDGTPDEPDPPQQ